MERDVRKRHEKTRASSHGGPHTLALTQPQINTALPAPLTSGFWALTGYDS